MCVPNLRCALQLTFLNFQNALLVVIFLAASIGCRPQATSPAPNAGGIAVPVTVSVPVEREVQDFEEFTGRIAAKSMVEIRSRVTGYLDAIKFEDGAEIDEGDLLFKIDPRPFQAAYDSVAAEITVAKANVAFRESELARYKELIKKSAISQSDLEQAAAQFLQANASVTAAEARTKSAKLNLQFTEIHAAIAGRVSRKNMDVGNLVVADQSLLTTIVSVNPVNVYFDVDERRLLRIRQQIRDGIIEVRERVDVPIEVALDNDHDFPHKGEVDFADNRVDSTTGTIQMRGVLPNPLPAKGQRILVPGMFARIRVPLGRRRTALLVAEQALGNDQGQRYLYVVDRQDEVQFRRVTIGKLDAGLRVIEDGLQAGDQVIVGGLQRVGPGDKVTPKPVDMLTFSTPTAANGKSNGKTPPNVPTPEKQ